MPISHDPKLVGARRRPNPRNACRHASWVASSASPASPSARRQAASRYGRWRLRRNDNASRSPPRAAATRSASASVRISAPVHDLVVSATVMISGYVAQQLGEKRPPVAGPRREPATARRRRGSWREGLARRELRSMSSGAGEWGTGRGRPPGRETRSGRLETGGRWRPIADPGGDIGLLAHASRVWLIVRVTAP